MLEVRDLVRFIEGRAIWPDLTFSLRPGDRVALRGPSGSGKTLLMRALVGLDAVDGGEIRFRDRALADWDIPEYRRLVRYIPQDAAFLSGTVRQSIELFFSFRANRDLRPDKRELSRFLDILSLPETFLDKTADFLSGGEKQMVAVMRSLLLRPEVLLLDEPTSNLDEAMVGRVESLIEDWMDGDGQRCFVWTSHDSRQLDRLTARSIELRPHPTEA
jgi:putative ABC transport system ATP-binding protein